MFKCDVCGREFNKKQSFTNHYRWHSNQFKEGMLKQVECPLCNKKLNGIGALNAHKFWCEKNNDQEIKERRKIIKDNTSEINKGNKHNEKGKVNIKCDYCNKNIIVFPYRIEENDHNFCSRDCYFQYLRSSKDHLNNGAFKEGQLSGTKSYSWKGGLIKVICSWCCKEIEVPPSRYKHGHNHTFCSKECYYKWHSKYLRGNKRWNWNPDREKVDKRNYTLRFKTDKEFREEIKKFQHYRDLLTGDLLEESAPLHHFDGNKTNDSHFIKKDKYCNVGFLNNKNHGKMQNKTKKEYYKKILIKNTIALRNREIPETWKEQNKKLYEIENMKQIKILKYI